MERKIEFVMDEVRMKGERTWVTGRCSKSLIRVGDIFESFCTQYFPNAEKKDFETVVRSDAQAIQLRIVAIDVFHRSIQELSPGMGAEIEVKGMGLELLTKGAVLMGNAKK